MKAKAKGALTFVCEALAEAEAAGMEDPKAMMVVRSRRHCAEYRAAMLRLLAAKEEGDAKREGAWRGGTPSQQSVADRLAVLVAFSGTLASRSDGRGSALAPRGLRRARQQRSRRFRDTAWPQRIL